MATAQTSYGALRGSDEDGVQVFRGVPFARPPLGPLRFQPPQRPEAWQEVRDATRFGPGSFQADRPLAPVLGIVIPEQDEDCLTLNVWTPGAGDGGRRPVYVWVHGGAWVIGSGREVTYDGGHLAKRGDVVVVTINYRLGAFGFLRSRGLGGGLESSGNEGLLDVVAALEWVRDEIAAFGGDPNDVTVGGESAGSVNVACLLAMPRAKGLFHKAVLESGPPSLLKSPDAAIAVTKLLLDELGLKPEEAGRLQDVPARELLDAQNRATKRSPGLATFGPIADGEVVPERPFDAIAAGSAQGVPVLIGTNQEEMKLYRFLDPGIDSLDEAALVKRCAALFPGTGPDGVSNAERAVATYRQARTARGEDASPAELWLAVTTDQVFRTGSLRLAELHAAHTPQTFVYRFDWKATAPGGPQGAIHALELPFVFGTLDRSEIGRLAGRTPKAHALSQQMQDAWLAFIRSGSPRSESLPDWPAYAPPRRATMLLAEQPQVVDAPMEAERSCWQPFLA